MIFYFYFYDYFRLLSELKESIEKKTKKIESLTSNVDLSKGSSTIDDKIREFNKNRLTWIARKSMCMDVVEMMSEGLGKKTTELTVRFLLCFVSFSSIFNFFLLVHDVYRNRQRHECSFASCKTIA